MHSSSVRAFQRHQEHNLKHPGLVDLITPKKLPSFIDRLEIDHVGQEQHKMKEQKAKLLGSIQTFFLGWWGVEGTAPNFGPQQNRKEHFVTISCQISPNFEEISTDLETSS